MGADSEENRWRWKRPIAQKIRLRTTLRMMELAMGMETLQLRPRQERSPGRRPKGTPKRLKIKKIKPMSMSRRPSAIRMRPSSDISSLMAEFVTFRMPLFDATESGPMQNTGSPYQVPVMLSEFIADVVERKFL